MKVHAEDTRYVVISPSTTFVEFVDLVRNKFGFFRDFKVKMRDEEGDMITMGDEEDLEMCMSACRKIAREEGNEMGKMDVSIDALTFASAAPTFHGVNERGCGIRLTFGHRSGYKSCDFGWSISAAVDISVLQCF